MKKFIVTGAAVTASLLAGEVAAAQTGDGSSIEFRAEVAASCRVVSVALTTMNGVDGFLIQTVCNRENFQIALRSSEETLKVSQASSEDAHVTPLEQQGEIVIRPYSPGLQRVFVETPDALQLSGLLAVDIGSS
jgi:hypothetical protein